MEFGELIQKIRKENQLTQQQMADRLYVTRQAVSNWENNKNLPDFYQIMDIARTYHVSLDELIPKGAEMSKMTEKLINDSKNTAAIKRNSKTHTIGFVCIFLGLLCIMLKVFLPSTIDEDGTLQENFFLLSLGFALLETGLASFTTALFANIKDLIKKRNTIVGNLPFILLETAMSALLTLFFFILIDGNSGTNMTGVIILFIVILAMALGGWLSLSVIIKKQKELKNTK